MKALIAAYPVCVAVARRVEFVRIQHRITQQNTQHMSVALHSGQVSRDVAVVVNDIRTDELPKDTKPRATDNFLPPRAKACSLSHHS